MLQCNIKIRWQKKNLHIYCETYLNDASTTCSQIYNNAPYSY